MLDRLSETTGTAGSDQTLGRRDPRARRAPRGRPGLLQRIERDLRAQRRAEERRERQLAPEQQARSRAEDALIQALTNIVGNAMKFTPRGGRILVRARRDENGVRFSVADDGPGIEPEHVAHVFDRFWQAHTDGHTGAGLGLAIARAIVVARGGEIWVESEPGSGATFHVRLPAPA